MFLSIIAAITVVMFPGEAKDKAVAAAYADRFAEVGATCIRLGDGQTLADLAEGKGGARLGLFGVGTGGRDALVALSGVATGKVDFVIADGLRGVLDAEGRLDSRFRFANGTCSMCLLDVADAGPGFRESTELYRQLRRLKVPSEVHVVESRRVGVGHRENAARAIEFLRERRVLPTLGETVDALTRFGDDGREKLVRKDLWPAGAGLYRQQEDTPYLEWNFPKARTTDAIQILYGGGGYSSNGIEGRECVPVRRYLNNKGVTVVTVHYRPRAPKGSPKHATAWQDLQRAIRLVKRDARGFGLDPERVGIMGFSAGGHLTLMGALSSTEAAYAPIDDTDRLPVGVQWAVAVYPAFVLTDGAEKPNAKGGNEDDAVPVPEFAFDRATVPVFFMHGDDDCWSSMNSVKVFERLRSMGVRSEVHTLAGRYHCFQYHAAPGTLSYNYMDVIYGFVSGFLSRNDTDGARGAR